jgi:hypothetical protein
MKNAFTMILAIAALAGIAFAAGFEQERGDALQARYSHSVCFSEQANAIADAYLECYATTDSELSSLQGQLATDMAALKSAADAANAQDFHQLLTGAIKDDLAAMTGRLKEIRQGMAGVGRNGSQARQCIVAAFKTSREEFGACKDNAVLEDGRTTLAWFNMWRGRWQEVITNMSGKNLSTSQMQSILGEADASAQSMQSAIDSGNPETVRSTAKSLREQHLHLWARFSIARVQSYLDALEPYANQYGMQGKVSEIRGLLSSASSLAQSGRAYSDGEWKTAWDTIKSAGQKTNELMKAIREAKKAGTS